MAIAYLDTKEIMELSDYDFAFWYRLKMQEYKEGDGWWCSKERIPKCTRCHDNIYGPKNLRRMSGMSLHPECFKEQLEQYKKENQVASYLIPFFERVAKLEPFSF